MAIEDSLDPTRSVTSGTTPAIRSRLPLGFGALSLVFAVALCVWQAPGDNGDATDAPLNADSYTRIVNGYLAPLGWLVRVDDPATGAPMVRLSKDARAEPAVLEFLNNSYLAKDLAANTPDLWEFDGGSVQGIYPNAHDLLGPFARRGGWRGDLLFSGTEAAMPVLVGPKGSFAFRRTASDKQSMISVPDGDISGDPSNLVSFFDGERKIASVRLIGNKAVLRIPCAAGRPQDVVVSTAAYSAQSCATARGDGAEGETADYIDYALADQDRVEFHNRASSAAASVFRLVQGREALSRYRPLAPRLPNANAGDLGGDIAKSLDSLSSTTAGQDYIDRDVALSLDAQVQAEVDGELHTYADSLRAALGRNANSPFPAAVTIMNASDGELLGLASYPRRADLSDDWDVRNSFLARNQNFVALPIGSTAKIPVSAAILSRFPILARLCISASAADDTGRGGFDTVLGVRLGGSIGDTVVGGDVGFDRFIQRSSNRFGAALIMLAAARPKPGNDGSVTGFVSGTFPLAPQDRYSFANADGCPGAIPESNVPRYVFSPLARQPAWATDQLATSRVYGSVDALPNALDDAQGAPSWIDWMAHGFALDGLSGDRGAANYDGSLWSKLLGDVASSKRAGSSGASNDQLDRYRNFAAVSPDRVRFDLGNNPDIRNGYIMTILGGGGARWTTIKLAESYARVVLRREIVASLTPGAAPMRESVPFWPIGDVAHDALLRGMTLVGASGTAAPVGALVKTLPVSNGEIRLFAKTGTPTLQQPARSRRNRLLDTMVRTHSIRFDSHAGLVLRDRGPGETTVNAIERLAADQRLTYRPGDAAWIDGTMRAVNDAWRAGDDGDLIFDRNSHLLGVRENEFRQLGKREIAEGGVLAMVVGRYCRGSSSERPMRALSIVINIQARTAGSVVGGRSRSGPNPAVEFAQRMLRGDSAVVRWLNRAMPGERACTS